MTQGPATDSDVASPTASPGASERTASATQERSASLSSTPVAQPSAGGGLSPLFVIGAALMVIGLIVLVVWGRLG